MNTQVDDGETDEDGCGWEVTSSSSDRRVVAEMLTLLDAAPGERVLEIGTGTGWSAAVMADAGVAVTSIEVDPGIADTAGARLESGGYAVHVVTGDGALGWPEGAPYDRLIATVGAATIPPAWVLQVRLGGRLVVPLTGEWQPPGIARAGAHRDRRGAAAGRSGGVHGHERPGAPAPARRRHRHRTGGVDHHHRAGGVEHRRAPLAAHRTRRGDRHRPAGPRHHLGLAVTGRVAPGHEWLLAGDSWATVSTLDGRPFTVVQAGPRRLVDEVLAGYRWWQDRGEPGVAAWLVTVGPVGQRVELDIPNTSRDDEDGPP